VDVDDVGDGGESGRERGLLAAAREERDERGQEREDVSAFHVNLLSELWDWNVVRGPEDSEDSQEPEDNADHHDGNDDLLDRAVHGDVGGSEPEQNTDHDE